MLAYGITPGPPMLDRFADITIMMVFSLALGNLAVTVIGMFLTGQLAKLTLIPYPLIGAIIIPISFLSAYLSSTDLIAIFIIVSAALLGPADEAVQMAEAAPSAGVHPGPHHRVQLPVGYLHPRHGVGC